MAYYTIHHCWLSVTYSQSYQPAFIGLNPAHSLSVLHATRPIPCLLLSLRDCIVCFVITKINRCTTCTFAFNSTVPKRNDAKLSFDCTSHSNHSVSCFVGAYILARWVGSKCLFQKQPIAYSHCICYSVVY
jgi:hypothetical protein